MLLTKIHTPSPGKNLVHRNSLFEKLNLGLSRKLILLSAPAGFGKTTLLSEWINQKNIPVAWFSIDSSDNDPDEFLSYIISGLQRLQSDIGQSAFEVLKSPNHPSPESILNLLINDIINSRSEYVLILDDFHVISKQEIFKLTTYLLEHLPDNLHVVISSRSDPNIPVAKLRSQNQLIELRSADLCFSANEISDLFNKKFRFKLSAEDIYSLESKTEGWIAGLQLAALSMQGNENASAFVEAFAGNNRYIMDYLIEEVLKNQSDELQEFLLKTSIFKQISAPLCNAVLDINDSQHKLEKLEKDNLFVVPLDTTQQWYRYHHLFADLLEQRLRLKYPHEIGELHDKATEWYKANGMFNMAIEHALENNNYEVSSHILSETIEVLWEGGQHGAIMKYGNLIPDEIIQHYPVFSLYYAWILIGAGQFQKALPFLNSAEQKNPEKNKLHGKISVAFAYLHSQYKHSEKIFNYCEAALEYLPENDPLWYSWAWFSYAIAYFSAGDLNKSNESYKKAFEFGKQSGNLYLMSTIAIRMAENEQQLGHYRSAYERCSYFLSLLKERGYSEIAKAEWSYATHYQILASTHFLWAEMDRAVENAKIAYDLAKKGNDTFLRTMILLSYSVILLELGDRESEKRIVELEELMDQTSVDPVLRSMFIGWKVYLLMHSNQIEQAFRVLKDYGLEPGEEISHLNEALYHSYARLFLAQDKLDEAARLLSELYTFANDNGRIERKVEIKISFAEMYYLEGNLPKAVTAIKEAIEIASEENMLAFFVLRAEHIKELLKEVYRDPGSLKSNNSAQFIEKLQLACEKRDKRKKMRAESELSARELDTLKLIAEDLTNQEIADKLFISLNTVKTHVSNIFHTVEVSNRSQAVIKAKERGII